MTVSTDRNGATPPGAHSTASRAETDARCILLDADGRVVAATGGWHPAESMRAPHAVAAPGADFVQACEAMRDTLGARALGLARDLRRLLAGEIASFEAGYEAPSAHGCQRVRLRASAWSCGAARGAMVLCTRIDDPLVADEQAQAREERYATIFQHNAFPMWVYDPDSLRILAVNDAALAHYGYDRDEFLALTIADIRPREDESALRADVSENRQFDVDTSRRLWKHRVKGGALIEVEIHAHQIVWEGRPARLVTAQDVTSRQSAMRALQESETRFRQITDCISEAFWLMEGGRLLYVSRGYETIWGRSSQELRDGVHHWRESIHPADRERVEIALPLQASGEYDIEYRIVRPDGRVVWIADRAFPVRGHGDGTPGTRRLVGVARDITERKSVEQQLQQSQRLESIGQLTGGIAHDFNNLLTVILGNAELLAEQLPQDALHHRLALMIGNAAQRGADLIQRLLAFARKQALEPRVVDIGSLLGDMDDMLRRTLGEQIEVARRCSDDTWPTLVDPAQLESALLNLAINARDATPAGGKLSFEIGNVRLATAAVGGSKGFHGDFVELKVSDTGSGIAEDQLQRVFEPFYTTKERGKGTGLGLAMVYGFVKQSNGHVTIESRIGYGTSVTIHLPRHHGGGAAGPADDAAQDETPLGSGQCVLLVEDDDMVRAYARNQLESLGYRVVEATHGVEAIAILKARPVDVLFTDVVMPGGLSGADLGRAARALIPELPILYTSGYAESALSSNGRLDPGVLLLGKPYRRAELAAKLRHAFFNPPHPENGGGR